MQSFASTPFTCIISQHAVVCGCLQRSSLADFELTTRARAIHGCIVKVLRWHVVGIPRNIGALVGYHVLAGPRRGLHGDVQK